MRDWGNVGTVVAVKEMVWSKSNGCVCVPGFVCGKSCILNEFREAIDCSKILSQIEEVNVPSQGSFNGGHCEFSHIKVSLEIDALGSGQILVSKARVIDSIAPSVLFDSALLGTRTFKAGLKCMTA